jgi:hypothetical protein
MSAVVRIVEYLNRDTISALEDMLARARRGEVLGLCFAFKTGPGHHGIGLTGEYISDPTDVLAVASRISIEVNMLVRERNKSGEQGQPE